MAKLTVKQYAERTLAYRAKREALGFNAPFLPPTRSRTTSIFYISAANRQLHWATWQTGALVKKSVQAYNPITGNGMGPVLLTNDVAGDPEIIKHLIAYGKPTPENI